MGDEINRLAVYEAESQRKDGVISQLRSELETIAVQLHQTQQKKGAVVGDVSVKKRQTEMEKDINLKQLEIDALKEKVSRSKVKVRIGQGLTTVRILYTPYISRGFYFREFRESGQLVANLTTRENIYLRSGRMNATCVRNISTPRSRI